MVQNRTAEKWEPLSLPASAHFEDYTSSISFALAMCLSKTGQEGILGVVSHLIDQEIRRQRLIIGLEPPAQAHTGKGWTILFSRTRTFLRSLQKRVQRHSFGIFSDINKLLEMSHILPRRLPPLDDSGVSIKDFHSIIPSCLSKTLWRQGKISQRHFGTYQASLRKIQNRL